MPQIAGDYFGVGSIISIVRRNDDEAWRTTLDDPKYRFGFLRIDYSDSTIPKFKRVSSIGQKIKFRVVWNY